MPSQERAKRAPLPRDPRHWAKEVDGIRRFLDRLPAWEAVWGPKWCEKQGEYYRSRLELLLANEPKARVKRKRNGRSNRRGSRG